MSSPLLLLPNTYRAFYGSFTSVYPFQQKTIKPILDKKDLILQATTGSGKSEAVLAPCIERVIQSNRKDALLYIVPTRALASDLVRRFNIIITQRLELNLSVRTGDLKKKGGQAPDIMITTPESLDVLLGSSNSDLRSFLPCIKMVIIDEVHQLVHQYRGKHLSFLLKRLELKGKNRFRKSAIQKIAISATIDSVDAIIDFFDFKPDAVCITNSAKRDIFPHFIHLKNEDYEIIPFLNDLYNIWEYKKILIFANSRAKCDQLFSIVNSDGYFKDVSYLHYSNLKTKERRTAEESFRKAHHALCIATSTLEIGIDIGDVDAILLYEPPDSVSAFLQRIGRGNRRLKSVSFWGICRGERASEQLLRFIALLKQAKDGKVEHSFPKFLPSVLAQQVISCVYEKKQISLRSLELLFPFYKEYFPLIIDSLTQKRWLRKSTIRGLLQGGKEYGNHLMEYKIWSNFPESEEQYTLELPEEAIADIPKSIVRQIDVGDKIFLAGRGVQILKIDTGQVKRLIARPVTDVDEKEIVWLGPGCHVSYEVAQAICNLLKNCNAKEVPGLFSRSCDLLSYEINLDKKAVMLENGIKVVRGKIGLYQFRTFIGSMGNLILEWIIKQSKEEKHEGFTIFSNEIGVECSHWIEFENLKLPITRKEFKIWIKKHFKMLKGIFSLNAFCYTLPYDLIVEELTDFIFDPRIAKKFSLYKQKSSRIISGDLKDIEINVQKIKPQTKSSILDIDLPEKSLLDREKQHFSSHQSFKPDLDINKLKSRTITATIISEYIRLNQCERQLCFKFFNVSPPLQKQSDQKKILIKKGEIFEQKVLDWLHKQKNLIAIKKANYKSFDEQFIVSTDLLKSLVQKDNSDTVYISHPVFIKESILKLNNPFNTHVKGVGIPDLVKISKNNQDTILQIGDIKVNPMPQYHHKWQVAFYANLLNSIIKEMDIDAKVSNSGFLLTNNFSKDHTDSYDKPFKEHCFSLAPYISAFPAILQSMEKSLAASDRAWHIGSYCVTCTWFNYCYSEALNLYDIKFFPYLTKGKLWKFQKQEWNTIEQAAQTSNLNLITDFSPDQKKRLQESFKAFTENRIILHKKNSRMFPGNISNPVFIFLTKDPSSSMPKSLGLLITDNSGKVLSCNTWNIMPIKEKDISIDSIESVKQSKQVWQEFSNIIVTIFNKQNYPYPHIFYFGKRSLQAILDWGENMEESQLLSVLNSCFTTDLQMVLKQHFTFPIHGNVTLYSLCYILGFHPMPPAPESLFHHDKISIKIDKDELDSDLQAYTLTDALETLNKLYNWIKLHINIEMQQQPCFLVNTATTDKDTYINFIKQEQTLSKENILDLQEHSLKERMERFRAIGHLSFVSNELDYEGRFVYRFKTSMKQTSKFRKGDFLKLTPEGVSDIQSGFPVILSEYDPSDGYVSVLSRQKRFLVSKNISYSLEEDTTDLTQKKLIHVTQTLFSSKKHDNLLQLLSGQLTDRQDNDCPIWIKTWLNKHDVFLNKTQKKAVETAFQYRLSMIQGPPGTGKTYVLGWILIALIQYAYEKKRMLRIAVSALTHQAIDNVLNKVVQIANNNNIQNFPCRIIKWSRDQSPQKEKGIMQVEFSDNRQDILQTPYLIIGGTGYGFYNLFDSKQQNFPSFFDWVIFDEASQIVIPQALTSLIYGKGNFLFLGDINQLPPIVLGEYDFLSDKIDPKDSVLKYLMDQYPQIQHTCLDLTYRMNQEICRFPSHTWYEGKLVPAKENAKSRLVLKDLVKDNLIDQIIDPEKPVTAVLTDHKGCHQKSQQEANIMASLAFSLIKHFKIAPGDIALITPYRAQNNTVAQCLGDLLKGDESMELPLIDTVERMQGAEKKIIIFSFTTSDADYIEQEFLNSSNRFNVVITRAKQKLIIIGSCLFFSHVPNTESCLISNACFKDFIKYCQELKSIFFWEST